jgi:peptide/nickel transport system substrate-binding protein
MTGTGVENRMSVQHSVRSFALAVLGGTLLAGSALAQTLTIGVRAGPESIDPHYTATGTHAEALKHVFDTLVWSGDKLQLEPGLATSWKVVDPTTWEFKLREVEDWWIDHDFIDDKLSAIEKLKSVVQGLAY